MLIQGHFVPTAIRFSSANGEAETQHDAGR